MNSNQSRFSIVTTLFSPGGVDSFWAFVLSHNRQNFRFEIVHQENNSYFPQALGNAAYQPVIAWFRLFRSFRLGLEYFYRQIPEVIAFNGTIAELHLTLPLLIARALRPRWKPRVMRVFHSSALYADPRKNEINRRLLRFVGRLYGDNVFVSDAVSKYWDLPGTILRRRFPRKEPLKAAKPETLRIGFFGRLAYEKGPDRFCEIVEALRKDHQFKPVVIGDGAMMSLMQERMPEAEFKGWLKEPRVALRELDLVLISSRTEGFPLAFGECLEMAVPVLGYEVGGVAELLGLASGEALVKDGDIGALLQKLKSWFADYQGMYERYFTAYDRNPNSDMNVIEHFLKTK